MHMFRNIFIICKMKTHNTCFWYYIWIRKGVLCLLEKAQFENTHNRSILKTAIPEIFSGPENGYSTNFSFYKNSFIKRQGKVNRASKAQVLILHSEGLSIKSVHNVSSYTSHRNI